MRGLDRFCGVVTALIALSACEVSETRKDTAYVAAGGVERTGAAERETCPATDAAIQVLGSGGPVAESTHNPGRAATSYLLWIEGEPRLLIDAGSGSFLRFAEAGGKIATLDAILLTHLHADHAGDLVDILNSGGFEGRTQPIPIIGPGEAPRFPAMSQFLERLTGKNNGAFAYNGGFLDGTENKPLIEPRDVPSLSGNGDLTPLDVSDDYSVLAYPVDHGPVPALGYEITVGDTAIVITGDQSARSVVFREALRGSSPAILFAHHVINGEQGQPRGLHRTPGEIGELAAAIAPARLVLTHNMERSLSRLDDNLAAIAESYDGLVSVADDLSCYAIGD